MASPEAAFLLLSNFWDIVLLNLMGVVVCLYSLHIEIQKEKDPTYKAYCDFNEHMSCSKVLTSKYSQGFGVAHLLLGKNHVLNARNCNVGLVVYIANIIMCFVLPLSILSSILYFVSFIMVIGCVYLGFVLFFILKDFCLVCVTTYFLNGCLLYLSSQMYAAS